MTIELSQRVAFLKKIHLFRRLTDEQVEIIASSMKEDTFPADKIIITEGSPADRFFLIYGGRVRVTRKIKGSEEQLAVFVPGDYFGEMGLMQRGRRVASVSALDDTHLLTLTSEDFGIFIKQFPFFKTNLEISISSRRLARKRHYKWLQPDEAIYFLARKHPILLWQSLLVPMLLALILASLFGWGWSLPNSTMMWISGILMLPILLWIEWNCIDWGNDYYIVTNQRIIWLEKVIGLYESRQEAPLDNIVFAGVETDMIGRLLDYGNVNVRTYVGRIVFSRVSHPFEAETLINELRERTRTVSRTIELATMKQTLRNRLGLTPKEPATPAGKPQAEITSPYKPGLLQLLSSKFFTLRFEYKDTITYHKHWFIWLRQTFKPGLAILGLLAAIIYITFLLPAPQTPISLFTIELDTLLGVLLITAILWLVYEWVDWSNDIFQVTPDNILDIDKTPLGREERKVAPLENILSTNYERLGILGLIFNYGTVHITVGGTQLAFEDVFDPAGVQQDIDQRRNARIFKKRAAETAAERERLADWFTVYRDIAADNPREAPRPQNHEEDSRGSDE